MGRTVTPHEMKVFIIETLGLEDLSPTEIDDDGPLFTDGLGLDSIDALELGIALRRAYLVQVEGEDPNLRDHFRSVTTLVSYVAKHGQAAVA